MVVTVEKSEISLPDGAIREVGEFDITLILAPEVTQEIKVNVVAQ